MRDRGGLEPRRQRRDDSESVESEPGIPAVERIRDVAIELFGERGFAGVSLKTIARRAGVSPPLVVHHYGSKAGLRRACDQYAAETVYRIKTESIQRGDELSAQYVLAASRQSKPLLRYLFQAFAAGGPEVDMLLDQLIDDSLAYTEHAEKQGLIKPSRNPRHRAAMMFLQSFGAMILHGQMKRLIGTSPVDDPPEQWGPYFDTVLEIYHGIFEPDAYEDLEASLSMPWTQETQSCTNDTLPGRSDENPHRKGQADA